MITSHYSHNVRFIFAETAKTFIQLCDFGEMPDGVRKLVNLIAEYLNKTSLRFVAPSATTHLADPTPAQLQNLPTFLRHALFPTRMLSAAESEGYFQKALETHRLSRNAEVIRVVICMGGVGCGDLIKLYLDPLIQQARQQARHGALMEICVVCGGNDSLKTALQSEYDSMPLPLGLSVNILGRVDNPELIALNQRSVLITKPGGGTISECIQNDCRSVLVHYDPSFPWEEGNFREIELQNRGKRADFNTVFADVEKLHEIREIARQSGAAVATPQFTKSALAMVTLQPSVPQHSGDLERMISCVGVFFDRHTVDGHSGASPTVIGSAAVREAVQPPVERLLFLVP